MKNLRLPLALAALGTAVLLPACGGEDTPAPPSAPPADARRVDESIAGQVTGRVLLEGPVPPDPPLSVATDAVCSRALSSGGARQTVVVGDGGLEHVFVYVKDGLGNYYFEQPAGPVKVDQKECRYLPHVFGVRVGQPIEFSNSDPTAHNVHAIAEVNRGFNFTQPLPGLRDTRTFQAREVMVRLKCDVHPWMTAYAGVLDHPYYAVTADGGRFELRNVPAGTYTVEAWHEKLGTRTQQVTLGEKEAKEITFTFSAAP